MPSVEVPWGDVVDRLTISDIKTSKFAGMDEKRQHAVVERDVLVQCLAKVTRWLPEQTCNTLDNLHLHLRDVNNNLWVVEDALRDHEKNGTWNSPDFVTLARSVYILNDKRAAIKRNINILLGSRVMEVKSHDLEIIPKAIKHPSDSVIIFGHLGLGDQLITFPLVVNAIISLKKEVVLVCNKQHAPTMRFLYKQLNEVVDFIWVNTTSDLSPAFGADASHLTLLEQLGYSITLLGLHDGRRCSNGQPFWHVFYEQCHMDPLLVLPIMRSFVVRDIASEKDLMSKVLKHHGIQEGDTYIVVHEDPQREYVLDRKLIPSDLPVVYVPGQWLQSNLFDFCTLLEHCYEFHAFDSCYAWLVELMELRIKRKVMHAYIKGDHNAHRLFASLHKTNITNWQDVWATS